MSKLTLCKAITAYLLCWLTPLTSFAGLLCAEIFTTEITREKPARIVDWNDDLSVLESKQRTARFGQVHTFFSKKWDTQVYHSNTGLPNSRGEIPLVDPNAKGVFVFLHGSGTIKSSGGNFISVMNKLSNLGYTSIAVDNPFHKQGSRDTKFNDANVYMEGVREIILEAKKSGLPIYVAGHSHGADVAFEYAVRYPNDINGAVPMSPAAFNKVLKKWNDKVTMKMTFGDVVINHRASDWGEIVSAQFLWPKGKLPDPTKVNPNLKIRVLTGNWEEYVPGPIGGPPNFLPIGPNTYDMSVPIKAAINGAIVTIEPGVGHYIFEHVDKDGYNAVIRELLMVADEHPRNIAALEQARKAELAKVHLPGQLAQKYVNDELFRTWADMTYGKGKVLKIANQANDAFAEKILNDYFYALKERDLVIFQKIINSKTTHPEFYEMYKSHIDKYTPKKLDTALFNPWLSYLTTGKTKASVED